MIPRWILSRGAVPALFLASVFCVSGQETVTIPKSRLEELERKEAELEKLKGQLHKTEGENVELKKQHQDDVLRQTQAPPPAQPLITHVSPPLESLPPLGNGDLVDAMDLANYYRSDPKAADARYHKRSFKVQGEIAAFEKPPFVSHYYILLKTAAPDMRVACSIEPPEKFSAIVIVKHGSELDGQLPGRTRIPIAKVGDKVVIEGECHGLSDSSITFSGCQLRSTP